MNRRELCGRVAFVTGGASGIGRSISRALSEVGCSVAIADIDEAEARDLEVEIGKGDGEAISIHCDVSCFEEVKAAEKEVRERFGPVSLLCNNAGVGGGIGPAAIEVSAESWEAVFSVNLNGVINGIRAFVPPMIEAAAGGHVVNTASMASFLPAAGTAPYTTTKFAVAGLSEVLRAELAEYSIGVSVLCPGPFRTGIWADGSGAKIARVLELEATRSGVEIRRGSRVGSLEREAEGFRVEMASSDEVDVRRAVVIATGGFGASREMLAKHYPTAT